MIARFSACATILLAAFAVFAQEARDTATVTIEGKQVTIEYGSPALKGRSLEELMKQLPADRIWRAGAGAVTKMETGTDLMIGGTKISAGKYSLYMYCPESGDYALVINSDPGQRLGSIIPNAPPERAGQLYPRFWNYTGDIADKEVARIALKQTASPSREMLEYTFQPDGDGALLAISWGGQTWTVTFRPAD